MKKSELKKEYLDGKAFWHITSKLNIDSIEKNGLVPRDGKRNGVNRSPEDPVPRVFFSQGIEGVLEQANNLAYLMNEFLHNIEKTSNGENGKDTKNKMNEFLNKGFNDEDEKYGNGGFIDIVTFIKEDIFQNGINENLTEEDIDKAVKDAEAHAAEDKKKKEEIEVRNNAESLIYNSEKTLGDLGDKISSEEKAKVQTEIDNTKKALESNNTDQIKEATEKLTKVFYDMSEQLYKNANPNGAAGVDPNAANGAETKNDGNVYDADYKVEDDDNK